VKAGVPVGRASRSRSSRFLRAGRPHTHQALAAAVGQAELAELAANLFAWDGRQGRDERDHPRRP